MILLYRQQLMELTAPTSANSVGIKNSQKSRFAFCCQFCHLKLNILKVTETDKWKWSLTIRFVATIDNSNHSETGIAEIQRGISYV